MKLVEIVWTDAINFPDKYTAEECAKMKLGDTRTVGYLIEETPEHVNTCSDHFLPVPGRADFVEQFGGVSLIPRGCVKSIRVVEDG